MNKKGIKIKLEKEIEAQIKAKAGKLLTDVAGYVSVQTMAIGLKQDLFSEIAKHPNGISVKDLAKVKGMDPFYLDVWMKSAYGSELLENKAENSFALAAHVEKLLLDRDFPGYIGGMPKVMTQPEMFGNFPDNLKSGNKTWWDKTSNEWIKSVIETTRPMYTRALNVGFAKVPGLEEKFNSGAHVMELASGAGDGVIRTAQKYNNITILGIDGDEYSIKLAEEATNNVKLNERIKYKKSMFEDVDYKNEFDVVTINASIHECRDIDKVFSNVYNSLKDDGYFVISDFPFPDTLEGLKTVPARIMSGIQFFESQIDDLLLPTQAYLDLLSKYKFKNIGSFDLTPTHMIVYGQK